MKFTPSAQIFLWLFFATAVFLTCELVKIL